MAEAEYPGIAKLVSRLVWVCVDPIHARLGQKPAKPCGTGDSGFSSGCRKRHKSGFDHINDHRQKNLWFSPPPWYNGRNWISGYSEVGIAPGLGPGDRAFEPHYSDQNPSEIVDFRGIFLILCLLRRKIYGYIVECRLKNMSKNHIISLQIFLQTWARGKILGLRFASID